MQYILKRFRGGNLLLEMLVVTAVIALAVGYVFPRYLEIRDSAVEATRAASAHSIAQVTVALINDNQVALPEEGQKTLLLSESSEDSDVRKIAGCLQGVGEEPIWTVTIGADGMVTVIGMDAETSREYAEQKAL